MTDHLSRITTELAKCSTDELADIAFGILEGKYRALPDSFVDVFYDAREAVDHARAQWADRNEGADELPLYDWQRHPDDPCYGARLAMWGK